MSGIGGRISELQLVQVTAMGRFVLLASLTEKVSFFILFVWLTQNVPAGVVGLLTTFFAFSTMLSSFLDFGFGIYIQREAAADTAEFKNRLHNILSVKLISCFFFFLIPIIYFSGIDQQYVSGLLLICASTAFITLNNLLSRVMIGKSLYKLPLKAVLIARLIFLAVLFLFRHKLNYNALLALYLGVSILQTLILKHYLSRAGLAMALRFNLLILKRIFASSIVISAGTVCVMLYDKADILLVNHFLGSEVTAQYGIAYSIYKMPQIFSAVLLVPLYTKLSAGGAAALSNFRVVKTLSFLLLAVSAAVILLCLLLSGNLVKFIYGSAYRDSGMILNGLIFALPGLLLNNLTGVALNAMHREKNVAAANFAGLSVNVLINYFLLPVTGIAAAVTAAIVNEYLVFIIQASSLKRYYLQCAGGI